MTTATSRERAWHLGATVRAFLTSILPFAVVGTVVFATYLALRRLMVPLADTTWRPLVGSLALLPHWVDPVALQYTALMGLRLPLLLTSFAMWLVAVVATAIATAFVLWWLAHDTGGRVPPIRRVVALVQFALGVSLVVVAVDYLFTFTTAVSLISALILAAAFGHFLAAPAAIVLDGRDPVGALRWCRRHCGSSATAIGAVSVVSMAVVRGLGTNLVGVLSDPVVGLGVATVGGTALVASLHAYVILEAYRSVRSPGRHRPRPLSER